MGCQTYGIEPCNHHVNGSHKPCEDSVKENHECQKKCTNSNYTVDFEADKHFGKTSYSVNRNPKQIQLEIFKNGPVSAEFPVYEDFLHYQSGVYQHVTGKAVGGHAIRILGWGVENDIPYWLIANSWNVS